MKALLDGDIYCFRAAASAENEAEVFIPCSRVDTMINATLDELGATEYDIYLTGKDNFRYKVYPEYKANRKGKPRPRWEVATKRYMIDQWQAQVIDGMEADDFLGINQTDDSIIVTIDKDLNQIPGWHYNFIKKEKYFVTPEEGEKYFWKQVLMGDTVDNIKGVAGIGIKTAEAIIETADPKDYHRVVLEQYSCEEELNLNATCVYILRQQDDTWQKQFLRG